MKKILIILILISLNIVSFAGDINNKEYRFTENKGQLINFDKEEINEFLFYTKSANLDIYFRKEGLTYIFKKGDKIQNSIDISVEEEEKLFKEFMKKQTLYYRLDIDFVNQDANSELLGLDKSGFKSNFYYAHCPKGIKNINSFEKIKYTNVYEGINFIFYFKDNKFKYDIEVSKGADISKISLMFNGAENINLLNNNIIIQSPVGEIIEDLPKSYYINNNKQEINTQIKYKLENNIVSFISEEKYDYHLVIDPQISWTSYYDDCFWNGSGSSIDVKSDQVVITSYGFNDEFPTLDAGGGAYFQNATAGSGDYRILKFDNDGVLQWATYYGGTDYDHSSGVKIDYSGNIYVVGHTESSDIPVLDAGGYYDATYNAGTYGGGSVILKFNSSGVLQWGTHYDFVAYPTIDIDHNNNVYVLGRSEYDDPPVLSLTGAYNQATVSPDAGTSASSDIFIVKFNSNTTRLWATNLGSTCDEFLIDVYIGKDNYLNILAYGDNYYGTGIVTKDPGAGAYFDNTLGIGSGGSSTDRDDALIYRFTPTGSLFWGTAFSGTLNENVQQGTITADSLNNIYIYAETASTDLPFTDPGSGAYFDNTFDASSSFNPFIAQFSGGGVLTWCTYFGTYGLGYGMNFSNYLGVNNDGNLILVSTDGGGVGGSKPIVPRVGDYNADLEVYMGVYIAEFNSNLGVDWSTYYAGTTDRHSLGDCALSSNSCGYELYMTTNWEKYNAAAINPPWVKPTPASYQDTSWLTTSNRSGLITRFSNVNSIAANSINALPNALCDGDSTLLTINGGVLGSGANWEWYSDSCGGNHINSSDSIYVSPTSTTTYYVRAEGTCNTTTCVPVTITLNTNSIEANSIDATQSSICIGDSVELSINGGSLGTGAQWEWFVDSCGSVGTPIDTGTTITVLPTDNTTYYVNATGTCNTTVCVNSLITISTPSTSATNINVDNSTICEGSSAELSIFGGDLGTGANWVWYQGDCGNGVSVGTGDTILVNPTTTSVYYVRAEGSCDTTACVSVVINVIDAPNAGTDSSKTVCFGDDNFDLFTILAGTPSGGGVWLNSNGDTLTSSIFNTVTMNTDIFTYYVNSTSICSDATANVSVTVNSLPNVNFTGLDSSYCENDNSITIIGNNSPYGVFLGENVVDNGDGTASFNPVKPGIITITYEFVDNNTCSNIDTQTVVVFQNPRIEYANVNDVSCVGNNDGSILVNINQGTPDYVYQWEGPDNFTSNNYQITNLIPGYYSLTVSDNNNCKISYSTNIEVNGDACLEIPNVITPNADGINDNFEITNISAYNSVDIQIFNRWGDKLFEYSGTGSGYADARNQWDGKYNGKDLPLGSYVYIVDIHVNDEVYNGTVTIIR